MSAGTESSFCESRRCRKIVKDPRTVFLWSNDKYLLTLSRYLSWPDVRVFFLFLLLFFSPLLFCRSSDQRLCRLRRFTSWKIQEETEGRGAYYSVPVLETAEIGTWRRKRKTVYGNGRFVCSLGIPPVVPVSAKRDLWTEQRRRWSVGKKRKTAREIPSCAGSKWPGQTRIPWSTNWSRQRTWSRRISRAPRVRYSTPSVRFRSRPLSFFCIDKYEWSRWNAT